MARMNPPNPLDVCRAIAAGHDCIGSLMLTYGRDALNKAAALDWIKLAPRVTLTKWGDRALRDSARDILYDGRYPIFRDHFCSRCGSGMVRACVEGNPNSCGWTHARNA